MKFIIVFFCLMGGTLFAQTTRPYTTTQPKPKMTDEQKLEKFGIAQSDKNMLGGLKVGEHAPNFSGLDQNGNTVELNELLKEGEVVVIFYRGYWCGICNRHLSNLEEQLSSITDKGATVIAVTSESNEYAKKTSEKNDLSFSVISDTDNTILSDYKVLYEVSESYQQKIVGFTNNSIKDYNDSDEAILPIPATYIIDQQGNISWKDYNINYSKRASVEDISQALK